MADNPLLDITTIVDERPFIRVDGKPYDLAIPSDFGVLQFAEIDRARRRITAINEKDEPSQEDVIELSERLDWLTRLLVRDMPDEVHGRLNDFMRLQIIQAFTRAVLGMVRGPLEPPTTEKTENPGQSTSEKSSQDSNTSTEATHTDG